MRLQKLNDDQLLEHAMLVTTELEFRELLEEPLPKIPHGQIDFDAAERKMLLEAVPGLQFPTNIMEGIKKQMDEIDKPPEISEVMNKSRKKEWEELAIDLFFWILVSLVFVSAGVFFYYLFKAGWQG